MLRQFIARFRNFAVVSVAAATLVIAPLTACGVKGPLKLPPPPTPAAAGAGVSSPEAPPAAATTEPPAASAPKPAETKP